MANLPDFSDEPEQKDIARWGVAALLCGALAIVSANVGAFVPEAVTEKLHATREHGGSFHQLRTLVLDLRAENGQIASDYRALRTRLNLLDDDKGEVVRRLAAVENSLPLLIESLPVGSDIDRSLLTASIGAAAGEMAEVDGGLMQVRQSALFAGSSPEIVEQPLPPEIVVAEVTAPLAANVRHGVALGAPLPGEAVAEVYRAMAEAAGTLLLGTTPLVTALETGMAQIIVGPLPDAGSAEQLCERFDRIDIACSPAAYAGEALAI